MAKETQPEKPLEAMMKNLKVDPSSEACNGNMAPPKDGNPSDATSCISSTGDATSSMKESDMDQESLMAEQGTYYPAGGYYGYYYPAFDGSFAEWEDQGCYVGTDGMEVQYPAMHSDNGSIFYYTGLQPGYNAYSPYVPGTVVGVDPQCLGQQPMFPNPGVPQTFTSPTYYPSSISYGEVFPFYPWDSSFFVDGNHGNGFGAGATVSGPKPSFPSGHTLYPSKSVPSSKFNNSVEKESPPVLGMAPTNHALKPSNKLSQPGSAFPAATVLSKGYFPIPKYQGKGAGLLYPSRPMNVKADDRSWVGSDKPKARGRSNGISDLDLLNEQNRGPRTNGAKNMMPGVDPVGSDTDADTNIISTVIKRDQYNLPDFPSKYEHALFYVIKSYSEDDIHKSIKYGVWASTPNGNKRLDSAYQEAQQKVAEKSSKCPVFLFFSVNASGQFCGVAEMSGRVDFNKNMDFWQQDKWTGFFPVKWQIIKDVPNPQFRHILLENNDNKPVTNSRDTQEVKFTQGIEMLNIFKNYSAKTSILDDFGFYESRQKAMQDKKIGPVTPHVEHLQRKIDDTEQVSKAVDLKSTVACQVPNEISPNKKSTEDVELASEAKK
ncbi:YTH domain-containing protein ECT2-like isoform X2 [Aristolochia californica]|uniref:YTH domain-containing protein ECT2-like isoform X2 n=1 Tax=Aristolochia californica TaxID=171875 RepID=UPI0035DB0807